VESELVLYRTHAEAVLSLRQKPQILQNKSR
jgi:hypothetical protein